MREKIKEKFASYFEAIIGNAIYDLLKFLAITVFGTLFVTFIGNVAIDVSGIIFLETYKIYILLLIIILTFIIILEVYTKNFKHIPNYPSLDMDYDILKKTISFTYGRDESKYEKHVFVKSNIKGLNRIRGKYTWSGSEEATVECVTKHCNIIPLTRKDSYIEYEIELGKNYNKGKRAECKVIGKLPDSQHKFVPFFSTQITEPTNELEINICIPPEYNVREVICEEITITRNSNDIYEIAQLDRDGKYSWKIHHPKLFYKYTIRWSL